MLAWYLSQFPKANLSARPFVGKAYNYSVLKRSNLVGSTRSEPAYPGGRFLHGLGKLNFWVGHYCFLIETKKELKTLFVGSFSFARYQTIQQQKVQMSQVLTSADVLE